MKLKVALGIFIVGLVMFSWVQFSYLPKMEAADKQEQLAQLEPETHNFSRVLEYESPYMGSAGNNLNLIYGLPMSDIPRTFQQDPEQFKFTVHYEKSIEDIGVKRVEKAILYNSTAIFALIKNMEIVEFTFPDETYAVTRERVNHWFAEDISTFNDEEIFKRKVQQPIIEKNRLQEWFAIYTKGGI